MKTRGRRADRATGRKPRVFRHIPRAGRHAQADSVSETRRTGPLRAGAGAVLCVVGISHPARGARLAGVRFRADLHADRHDPGAVDAVHGEAEAVDLDAVALLRGAAELAEDVPADGVVV